MRTARRAALVALMGFSAAAGPAWAAPSADEDNQALNADADYAAGRGALKSGRTEAALASFQRALRRFPEAADLHNELGFTHRKLRQMDKAFEHYKKALALDPRHRGAHEYIGEAYLMVGNLSAAEEHLAALRSICLLGCEELDDLRRAIAEFKARPR